MGVWVMLSVGVCWCVYVALVKILISILKLSKLGQCSFLTGSTTENQLIIFHIHKYMCMYVCYVIYVYINICIILCCVFVMLMLSDLFILHWILGGLSSAFAFSLYLQVIRLNIWKIKRNYNRDCCLVNCVSEISY